MARWRSGLAALYIAGIGAFFGSYYYAERVTDPDTVVDPTGMLILIGLVGFFVGLAIARWWAVLLPLAALPFGLLLTIVAALDSGFGQAGNDAPSVLVWLALGATLALFIGCPEVAAGVGLARLVGSLTRRIAARREQRSERHAT